MSGSEERAEREDQRASGRTSRRRVTREASRHHRVPQPDPNTLEAGMHAPAPADDPTGYLGPLPPSLPPPGRTSWTYIDRPSTLARVAPALCAARVIAIDAEFVQVRDRRPEDPPHRLALLQLAVLPGSQGAFVIDPLRISDLTLLEAPLSDGRILKLFHGMGADARVLATRGLVSRHTLDLEAVSRSIFGQRESSLQSMLLRACGVRLDKSLQRSDWSHRPLAPARLAYAARDAEMTLLLYTWLAAHYAWATALHETSADETRPEVAAWLVPFLEGARPSRVEWPVAEARMEPGAPGQAEALRAALAAVRRPGHRARLIRLVADLELAELCPELHPLLAAPAAEERSAAARALGRLRDQSAGPALRVLLGDPVYDVRQAAQSALDALAGRATPAFAVAHRQQGAQASWSVGSSVDQAEADWQATLRARFGGTRPEEGTNGEPGDMPQPGGPASLPQPDRTEQ